MIGGSILYLWLAGLDMGTAAEQLLNGMYTSYILLAVPLFIFAAEIMNSGSMTDAPARSSATRWSGASAAGSPRSTCVQSDHLRRHVGLGDRRRRRHRQADADDDDERTASTPPSFAAALTAVSSVIGPIIPPSIPMVVYALVSDASIGYLFIAGVVPGLLMGLAQMALIALIARRRNFPVGDAGPAPRDPRHHLRAFPALMMPVVLLGCIYSRHHHADRGRRDRRRLRLPDLGAALPRA